VSQLVKTYCGRSFIDYYDTDKVEYFTLDYTTHVIQVNEGPILSVTLVEERSSYQAGYNALSDGSFEYYVDAYTDSIYRTSGSGFAYWAQGPGSVKVTYKGGYSEIPADLKLAVVDLINYYFKEEYKKNRTIGGSTMANEPTSTQWRNVGFPDHIKRVLDLYKNIEI
jgi:hypothetical protein